MRVGDGDCTVGDHVEQFHGLVTADARMKELFRIARRAANTDVTVLVRGETGTGKELVASGLHEFSRRRKGPFSAINCAALSPALLESELFGHVRGAFTGAVRDKPGHFRHAHTGTLFLDEVADMPPDLQSKLLRVIETGQVLPVGAMDPVAVDVRIVAATHKSLRDQVTAGLFRADLMYRLRKVPLFLPPLRERPDDVNLLLSLFVSRFNDRGGRVIRRIDGKALTILQRYGWPGNVRELANVLEYAYVVGDGRTLTANELPDELGDPSLSAQALYAAAPAATHSTALAAGPPAGTTSTSEDERIRLALRKHRGHRERTARELGISRVTLWRRMREYGIDDE